MFEEANLFNKKGKIIEEGSKVTIKKEDGAMFQYKISKNTVKGQFAVVFKQIRHTSALAEVMMGRKEGDGFVFGGVVYVVNKIK